MLEWVRHIDVPIGSWKAVQDSSDCIPLYTAVVRSRSPKESISVNALF